MTQLTDNIYAVEVPEDVVDFKTFVKRVMDGTVDVPTGRARFLFTTGTATEKDARKVVGLRRNYFTEVLPSLHSLLRSKGLDPNKNYALIEKQSSDE